MELPIEFCIKATFLFVGIFLCLSALGTFGYRLFDTSTDIFVRVLRVAAISWLASVIVTFFII
jgi:hypothetical protein